MSEKVLVIDDDPGFLTLMRLGLEREGFSVVTAENGKEGLRWAYEARPDIIVLDVMMPEMDGWVTCQRLRYVSDTPIILLTAKSEQADIVKGLSMGADDYLTKPCSFDELKVRLRTVLRRTSGDGGDAWREVFDDGHLYVDLRDSTVKREGEEVHLTPIESRLFLYLVGQHGRIVPHKELLVNVWGPEYADEVSYLSVYIRYLRRKIEEDPSDPKYIRTRWGVGYYFSGSGSFWLERDGDDKERSRYDETS